MIADLTNLDVGYFIHTLGDAHIYTNHFDQIELQLSRDPKPLPTLKLNPNITDLFDFKYEDFEIIDYESHPAISAPISV